MRHPTIEYIHQSPISSNHPSLSMYSRSQCIKGKPPAPSMPLPHPLGQQIRTDEIACNRIPTPQTRYLQCMQTDIPTLDMKLIITNRTSSFPVISLLYFYSSSYLAVPNQVSIIASSPPSMNATPQAALLCMYKLNSITNNMITFQLNRTCIQPIPLVASSTPILCTTTSTRPRKI